MLTSPCQSHTWGCRQNSRGRGSGSGNGSDPKGRGAVTLATETLADVSSQTGHFSVTLPYVPPTTILRPQAVFEQL